MERDKIFVEEDKKMGKKGRKIFEEEKSLTGRRRRETPGIDRYPIGPTMI